ncbi:CobQ/CobB/MinD/ParA nucleotide binding domain protein [Thermincola ferriacetica]|uniref:CobQ/CobB/MinD/ParA nucleotide binding domain protein n=1 Tax=Thermincola ferriacetica TaxID=281456 RepID=A0A0L6W495_9FIRM|nr:hypothetical protein [Thermincola ferriacetica]KNZ70355.1 CobQ/CobB/MinD/ParA nucleotide binding domain protein [Thermincola ferriacetica]
MKILLITNDYDLIGKAQQTEHSVISTTTISGATDLLKQHNFDMIALGVPYCDLPDIEAGFKKKYKKVIKIRGKDFIIPGDDKAEASKTSEQQSLQPPAPSRAGAQQVQTTVQPVQPKQPEARPPEQPRTVAQLQAAPQKPAAEPVRTEPVTAGSKPPSDLLRSCRQILLISQNRETIVAVREGPHGGKTTVAVSQASAKQIMTGKPVDLVIFDLNETPAFDYGCPVIRLGTDIPVSDLSEPQEKLREDNQEETWAEKPGGTSGGKPVEEKSGTLTEPVPEKQAEPEPAPVPEEPGAPAADNSVPVPETRNTVAAALADEGPPKARTQPGQTESDILLDSDLFEYAVGPAPLVVGDDEEAGQADEGEGLLGHLERLTQTAKRQINEITGTAAKAGGIGSILGGTVKNLRKPGKKQQKVKKIYQHVIGITGTKGGLGRTTLALDMAQELSRDASVLIIDLNFQAGGSDLSYLAGLPQVPNFLTFRSEKLLQEAVCWCGGISILQPPPCDALQAKLEPSDVEFAVGEAVRNYDVIIIDLPATEDAVCAAARQQVTATVIMTSGSMTEVNRLLKKVEQWPRPVVVVNGSNEAKAENHIQTATCWLLPKKNSSDYRSVVEALAESIITSR